jgi:rhodanese-related sulfurtransferase
MFNFRVLLCALMFMPFAVTASYVSPETVSGTTLVSASEAKTLFDKGIRFVDVRVAADYEAGRIPEADNLTIQRDEAKSPFTEASLLKLLGAKDTPAVFYCNATACWRTAEAAKRAVGWGFTNIYYFRMGFPAWRDAGYPVE